MVRIRDSAWIEPIFTLPRFAGGSSLSEGRALPGEAPTLPLEDSREGEYSREGEDVAYLVGSFETDHQARRAGRVRFLLPWAA